DEIEMKDQESLVSSGVVFGTVQLLPNKQLIILMADHQTMGGYPVIANIISAHLPLLAQMNANDKLSFRSTNIVQAEEKLVSQQHYLLSVQHASFFKMQNLLT